jgi:hypothetical protein
VRGTDFSKFKTYNWRLSPQPVQDAIWNARIISYVDAQSSAKGLRKAGPGQPPDLIVRYVAGVQRQALPSDSYASGPSGLIEKVEQNQASLKLYLADPRKPAVVWCALATDVLDNLSDKNVSRVKNVIQEMLKDYPPGK